jgi:SAM-dependent methyltransferase
VGGEVDLLRYFPRGGANREARAPVTDADRELSRQFGFDYFDGSRQHGYGGYRYDPKYWGRTVDLMIEHFSLNPGASILDVGCAKGFTMYDFSRALPTQRVVGLDVSEYALAHRMQDERLSYVRGTAETLPFADDSFDLVICINTLHNLPLELCKEGVREIERVSRGGSYIVVDGWRTLEEEQSLREWVLTAQTMMSASEWGDLFTECGFSGDYSMWSLPAS